MKLRIAIMKDFSPSVEDISSVVQLISHCCSIDLHTCCEHNQVVPLGHNVEEKVDVRSLVHKESDRMSIDDNRYLGMRISKS